MTTTIVATNVHFHGLSAVQFDQLTRSLKTIMDSINQITDRINAYADQVNKANAEVQAALAALREQLAASGQASPELQAAVDRLGLAVQAIDDLNPDAASADAGAQG